MSLPLAACQSLRSHVLLELLRTGKYLPVVMDNGHNSKAEACITRVQEVAEEEPG